MQLESSLRPYLPSLFIPTTMGAATTEEEEEDEERAAAMGPACTPHQRELFYRKKRLLLLDLHLPPRRQHLLQSPMSPSPSSPSSPPAPPGGDQAAAAAEEDAARGGGGCEHAQDSPSGGDGCACDEFRMYAFKVRPCARGRGHDWTSCPFAHAGEKARRRDPRLFRYSGSACQEYRREGSCPRGDACGFAHGVFECWLHPERYRTMPCRDGRACCRKVCFFAHSPCELRVPREGGAAAPSSSSCSSSSSNVVALVAPGGGEDGRCNHATFHGVAGGGTVWPDLGWVEELVM